MPDGTTTPGPATPSDAERRRPAALDTWRLHGRWSATSGALKRRTQRWKAIAFALGLAAIVLGPLSTHADAASAPWLSPALRHALT